MSSTNEEFNALLSAAAHEADEAFKGALSYEPPDGDYTFALDSLDLKPSKDKKTGKVLPRVEICFRIIGGEHDGKAVILNGPVTFQSLVRVVTDCAKALQGSSDIADFAAALRICKDATGRNFAVNVSRSSPDDKGRIFTNYRVQGAMAA